MDQDFYKGIEASSMSVEEMCRYMGADSLGFLSVGSMKDIAKECRLGFCDACFTGKYPLDVSDTSREDKYSRKIETIEQTGGKL